MLVNLIESVYRLLWGDLFTIPLGGGIGISFMVVLLFTAGIWFTCRTRLLPVRLFRDMIAAVCEKKQGRDGLSSFQTLVISTATRVGMGNLVGVVAAVSAGGAGAVFWMWVTAILGASTSFIESTLAQKYRQPDPLYGGWRGGPAYYLHVLAERRRGKKLKRSVVAALFAVSGLICWCGISQVISNSVSSAFENAFHIPPLTTTLVLTAIAAVIVLRKNATVKSLDVMVPIMAVCYFRHHRGHRAVQPAQAPGGVRAHLCGSVRSAAGRGWRLWCCADERCQARPVLQRSGQRFGTLCSCRRRVRRPGQDGLCAGTGRADRYGGDLQLHGLFDAAGAAG